MHAIYEVWLLTDDGERIKPLKDLTTLEYVRVFNAPNRFSVIIPYQQLNMFIDRPDFRIEIWRGIDGVQEKRVELGGFIRSISYTTDDKGQTNVVLSGPDFMDLLNRRIVAYRVGVANRSDFASRKADNLMKDLVSYNLGANATTDYKGDPETGRNLASFGFSQQADLGLGPELDKMCAWRNLLLTLQEVSQSADKAGTPTYFDVVYTPSDTFEFQTFINQPGRDRTADSDSPVILGLDRGNLGAPVLMLDFENEVTHVYAGGEGDSSISTTSRIIQEAEDTTRKNTSIWNRREVFLDVKMEDTAAKVADSAEARLHEGRPVRVFTGQVLDIPNTRYGRDWDLGDKLTVDYLGNYFDVIVNGVSVSLDEAGGETVVGQLVLV